MANTLRFKRGLVSGIPTAALGEPLFTTDTFDLYIGNGTGNTRFQKYIASGTTSQLLRGDGSLLTMPIVLTSPSNGQVLKYDGTNWVNSADAGVTGSGIAGQVTYWGSSSTITGSNNLFWDNANSRLGIGTNTPTAGASLHVAGSLGSFLALSNGAQINFTRDGNNAIDVTGGASAQLQIRATSNLQFHTGSTITERMRLFSNGNLALGNPSVDNGLRFQVTGDGYFSGSVGIGTSSLTGRSLSVSKNITGQYIFSGGSYGVGVLVDGVVQSDEVGGAAYFRSFAQTQAASFTAGAVYHFEAVQGTFGAGSSVSNQVGFFAAGTLVGATNNYGFYGNIAAGTNRWNLYMNGTATNFLNGSVGIGTTSLTGFSLRVNKNITGAATSYGVRSDGIVQSDVSGQAIGYDSSLGTQAAAFTLPVLTHYRADQSTFGAGSAVTTQYGFQVRSNLIGATNNYGFFGDIASGTGRWNLYMNGTAANYLNGNLSLGTTNSFAKINTFGHILAVNGTGAGSGSQLYLGSLDFTNSTYWNSAPGIGAVYSATSSVASDLGFYTYAGNPNSRTERMRIFYTGNILIQSGGTYTDAGFKLDVNGTMRSSSYITAATEFRINNQSFTRIAIGDTGGGFAGGYNLALSSGITPIHDSTGAIAGVHYRSNGTIQFYTGTSQAANTTATERMRLDASGNLGLGVTPSAWGSNWDAFQIGVSPSISNFIQNSTLAITNNGYHNNTNWIYTITAAAAQYAQLPTGNHAWYTAPSGTAGNAITFTQAMTLDASGNLGLGIVPSAWGSTSRAIQIGTTTGLENWSGSTVLENNGFRNSAGNYIYLTSSFATSYAQSANGRHEWYVAPSGTAGGTITFAQAMTMFNDGNLALNTVTNAGFKLDVNGTSRITGNATFGTNTLFVDNGSTRVGIGNTAPNGKIDITGSLGSLRLLDSGAELYFTRNGNNDFYANGGSSAAISIGAQSHVRFLTGTTLTEIARFTTNAFQFADGINIVTNATTGTKIGTATSQKLSFWNAAPIIQPTTSVAAATRVPGGGATITDLDTFDGYTVNQIVKALRNAGLLA